MKIDEDVGDYPALPDGFHWGGHSSNLDFIIKYVPVSLDTLIKQSKYPVEHLEIDCEGGEVEVFKTFSFKIPPPFIKVACHGPIKPFLTSIFKKHRYDVSEDEEHLFAKRSL